MEIWKDIKGYEGLYKVSNHGRVKNLERKVNCKGGYSRFIKERILKPQLDRNYQHVGLSKNNKVKIMQIHILVAIMFLGHKPDGYKLVVDHIDNNSLNNRYDNLQIVSHRINCSKDKKGTSKYAGVSWYKRDGKWQSYIYINGKGIGLGRFENEIDASNAYQYALSKLK